MAETIVFTDWYGRTYTVPTDSTTPNTNDGRVLEAWLTSKGYNAIVGIWKK